MIFNTFGQLIYQSNCFFGISLSPGNRDKEGIKFYY